MVGGWSVLRTESRERDSGCRIEMPSQSEVLYHGSTSYGGGNMEMSGRLHRKARGEGMDGRAGI